MNANISKGRAFYIFKIYTDRHTVKQVLTFYFLVLFVYKL